MGSYRPVSGKHFIKETLPRKSTGSYSDHSLGTDMSKWKTDPDTQNLVERRSKEIAQWKIHWQTPAMMVILFIVGMAGAIAHHLFYSTLNGRPANKQLTMIRYGTALAFFTKACLVGSVVSSFKQRIWHTFRSRAMTVGAIDGLFAVIENPWYFTQFEMLRNAKLATLMALGVWSIPIAAVLSPAALTSGVKTSAINGTCPNSPVLNFNNEESYNFRNVASFAGGSLFYVNTTDVSAGPGYFDYFDQPSKNARRLTIISAYLKRVSQGESVASQACGNSRNCTYNMDFSGPGYDCDIVANGSSTDQSRLEELGATFNMSILAPEGDMVYYADVDTGDYPDPQLPTNEDGEPIQQSPPWPEFLGVFKAEPVLWIGQSVNTSEPWPEGSPYSEQWPTVRQPKIFRCVHKMTDYRVNMTFVNAIQGTNVTNRTFLDPIIDTFIKPDSNNITNLTITPESNYVRPDKDIGKYKLTAAYHSLGLLLRNFLRGSIAHKSDGTYLLTRSDISETRLINPETSYPVEDLQAQIQTFYEDMILTLLSEPHLIIASNKSVPCTKFRSVIVFQYNVGSLWTGYAIAIAVTLAFLIVGGCSILSNGVASDTRFSRIMVTTRNPTIDRLSVGACLGGDPFPLDLRKVKLRFGVLTEDEGEYGSEGGMRHTVEHCTFGTVGETKPIVKNGVYAGLRAWRDEMSDSDGSGDGKEGLLSD
ncbi:hypothetical protein K490DRAFT_51695 [Saccharata proteae CBS 121410]|uniref:Uncharacterized protein n=1 Tax=Saccharata proteae CBS 121410 TaxID=1314787 RepID=A0A9P4HMB5_9PEZI|nr:hypothetical protein K490DRAFT_51695 [Saccharata proteae CBS 121410]